MITRERFDLLKRRWSACSSWAVWPAHVAGEAPKTGIGDLSVLDPDANPMLLGELNPDMVLVGLNASSRPGMSPEPWRNFHDSSPVANDFKIRFALEGTRCWGAYMTDVFVDLPETKSTVVKRWIAENPDLVGRQLDRFEEELSDLGSETPLIVAFGDMAYEALSYRLGNAHRVTKVLHYSNYISKENYRERALLVLDAARQEAAMGGSHAVNETKAPAVPDCSYTERRHRIEGRGTRGVSIPG